MISDIFLRAVKPVKRIPLDIDHFSIENIGSKFYLYAHPNEGDFYKRKIGTFADYESAKAMADSIIDLKLPQNFAD